MKRTLLFVLALIAAGCAPAEQSETLSDGSEQVIPYNLRTPEDVVEAVTTGVLAAEKVRPYLAILVVYERLDLAYRCLSLLRQSSQIVEEQYIRVAMEIVDRRKRSFDSRFVAARALGILAAHLGAPHSSFHYLY